MGYCLDKAWADATQRERFKGRQQSEIIKNKKEIIDALRTEIEDRKFSSDYDTWHNEVCSRNVHDMTYGIWQKFINMTFKYMRCSGKFSKIDFSQCHCPIDSIIAQRVDTLCIVCDVTRSNTMRLIARSGKTNWNNIGAEEYREVRSVIQNIIKKCTINNTDNKHPTELEFDFLFW